MAPMTPLSSQFFLLCLYCIFTLVVGFQIARILYYRHALVSFQLGFLVLCFVWGIVRIFTWSIMDSAFAYFLQIPINLQFATFSLLVIFYAHLVHKSTWERSTRKRFTIAYIVVNTILLVSSLTTLALSEQKSGNGSDNDPTKTKLDDAQQGIAGLVFLILVGILAWYGYRLHVAISSTAKHQMLFQVPPGLFVVTCIIILIFLSRCIYDFITISGKYSVSFESSSEHDDNTQVFIFFAYFIWEIVPATLIIGLFWRIPTTHIGGITRRGKTSLFMLPPSAVQPVPSAGIVSRLFNDPQRYDSDDETTGLIHKGTPITYTTPPKPSSYTYSIGKNTPYATSRENTPHLDSVLKGPPPTLSSISSVSSVSSIPRPSTPSTSSLHRPSTPSVQTSNPSLHFTPHVVNNINNNNNIVSNNNNNNNTNNMENTSISIPGNA